jgi:hypothetical protein
MNAIFENILTASGYGFLIKTAIHIYVNYSLIDNYCHANRGGVGVDPMLLLPIFEDNVKGNRWVIKLANILYYFFLVSIFIHLLINFF